MRNTPPPSPPSMLLTKPGLRIFAALALALCAALAAPAYGQVSPPAPDAARSALDDAPTSRTEAPESRREGGNGDIVIGNPESTIKEGKSASWTVRLSKQPTGDVTVTITTNAPVVIDTDFKTDGNQNTLTFTTSNYKNGKTIRVTAPQDDNSDDESGSITYTAKGGGYDRVSSMPIFTKDDDKIPKLKVNITNPIAEGETGEITLTLSKALSKRVGFYIDIMRKECGIGFIAGQPTFKCPPGTQPADREELAFSGMTEPTHGHVYIDAGDVTKTIAIEALADTKGEPTEIIQFRLIMTAGGVPVKNMCDDCIVDPATPPYAYSFKTPYRTLDGPVWFIQIKDASQQILLQVNNATSPIMEGTKGSYQAKLASQPTADVTVTVSGAGGTDLTVDTDGSTDGDQNTLTFTRSNWNDWQGVDIAAGHDDDTRDEKVTLTHTAAGGDYEGKRADMFISIKDDDEVGITVTQSNGSTVVTEGGAGDTYSIALGSRPAHDVSVALQVRPGAVLTVNGSPALSHTLRFAPAAWDTPQTVSVAAIDDATDNPGGSRSATITHTSSSADADYDGLSIDKVSVTIIDDDPTRVTLSTPDATATEGDPSDPAKIVLTLNRVLGPGETLAIPLQFSGGALGTDFTLSKISGARVTLAANRVTFEGPKNGTTAQEAEVALIASKDPDALDKTITVSIPASSGSGSPKLSATGLAGGAVGTRTGNGDILFKDNDDAIVHFATSASSTPEASGEHNIRINLNPAPRHISLGLDSFDFSGSTAVLGEDYTWGSPSGKTGPFSISPGNAFVDIPVIIIDDRVTEGDETIVVRIKDHKNYIVADPKVHTLTITDNDKANVTVAPQSLALDEGGPPGNYTFVLDTEPSGAVTVTATSSDPGAVAVEPGTLTFNRRTWSTPQPVTVTAVNDGDADNENVTITHAISGYAGKTSGPDVAVAVTDDDERGVTVTPLSLSLDEGGSAGTYDVVLDTDPGGTVTVTASSSDEGAVTVAPGTLTFDDSDWDTPQAVTVRPVDDADAEDENVTITHAVSGYTVIVKGVIEAGVTSADPVAVVVDDDEIPTAPGVDAGKLSVELKEGGPDGAYTLVLRTDPGGRVTVTPTSSDPGAVTVSGALTFDSSNWDREQTVTVAPQDDADADNENVTISHAVSGYAGVASGPTIAATVEDDDEPVPAGVNASTLNIALKEGGPGDAYTLVLRTDPGGRVTVTPRSSDPGAVAVSGALTFDSSNWDREQTVTVAPQDDLDADNENVTISHAVSGYAGLPSGPTVVATVEDDDEPAPEVSFASSASSAGEGAGSVNVAVNLDPAPQAPLTLRYATGGTATAGVDYGVANLGTVVAGANAASVSIPVTLADDSEEEPNETIVLTLADSGDYLLGAVKSHTLTITDNDEAGGGGGGGGGDPSEVTLSVAPNPVTEGEEATVTVTLSQAAPGAVTIPLVLTAGAAEEGDYDAPAAIAIAANATSGTGVIATVADADLDDETFTVALGTLIADFAGSAQGSSVEVKIMDDTRVAVVEFEPADGAAANGQGEGSQASVATPAPGFSDATSAEEEIPTAFALEQNYPNPFNPVTTIEFALARTQRVTLAVYDLLGQKVRTLVDGVRPAARYRAAFDASGLASGTYLYVLRTEEQTAVRKMALMK